MDHFAWLNFYLYLKGEYIKMNSCLTLKFCVLLQNASLHQNDSGAISAQLKTAHFVPSECPTVAPGSKGCVTVSPQQSPRSVFLSPPSATSRESTSGSLNFHGEGSPGPQPSRTPGSLPLTWVSCSSPVYRQQAPPQTVTFFCHLSPKAALTLPQNLI